MPKAIKSPEQRKRKPKEVDNDKARKTIVQGTTTVSTDDANKANHNKTLNASVATSINSTTQSGTTIHAAGHVDVRTCISPAHTQQVMSSIDTTLGKNQSS
jgi:5-deoxy-D-glucuronate isomerase